MSIAQKLIPVAILVARTPEYWWTFTIVINGHPEKTSPELFTSPDVAFRTALFELNRRGYYNG